MSEAKTNLSDALAAAQGEFGTWEKDGKGGRGNRYGTLQSLLDAVRPVLSRNGIALTQDVLSDEHGHIGFATRLSGHGEVMTFGPVFVVPDEGGRMNPMQALGSTTTYMRRYTLSAALGIAPDDDDDGESSRGRAPQQRQPQRPSRPKTAWSVAEVGNLLASEFGPAGDDGPPEAAQAYVHEVTKMTIPQMMDSPTARAAMGVALSKEQRR